MPRAYVTSRGHTGVSFGCLGTLVYGFLSLMAFVLFAALLVAIAGIFAVGVIVALVSLGVDRLLMATSPMWRARRAVRGRFRPVGKVTDTTARVVHRGKPKLQ
jgi:uncharacterized protein (DUF58 family)